MRRSIRGGMGLGDALYVQSVVRHLVEKGESLKVCTAWPDVFRQLGPQVSVAPFTRQVQILAHYSTRKQKAGTTQFEDCCYTAGIRDPVELRLDWRVEDEEFVSRLKDAAAGRAIVLLGMPRAPMGRKDGFGAEVLPNCAVIQKAVDRLKEEKGALIVQIGSGASLHAFRGVDLDWANRTTVGQLLDISTAADAFVGYCSFVVPLAESLSKPALFVWSRRGLRSGTPYIAAITPTKILQKPTSRYLVDDATDEQIREAADALL